MRALERPYPSFSLVLSQQPNFMCLPTYSISHVRHSETKSGQVGTTMGTVDARHGGCFPDTETLINLEEAISPNEHRDTGRVRRLNFSALVIVSLRLVLCYYSQWLCHTMIQDLALMVKYRPGKDRPIQKEEFAPFTPWSFRSCRGFKSYINRLCFRF